MDRRWQGFSLHELVVTLALVAVVAGLGVPSFLDVLARQRQRVELNALFHAIHLARKESIVRKQVVSVCPSKDGKSCSAGRDWSDFWIMFENPDRDEPPAIDPGEAVVQVHQVDERIQIRSNRRAYTMRAVNRRTTNGTLVVCDRLGRVQPRAVVLSYTGRPRVAEKTTRGKPYSCAD